MVFWFFEEFFEFVDGLAAEEVFDFAGFDFGGVWR